MYTTEQKNIDRYKTMSQQKARNNYKIWTKYQ